MHDGPASGMGAPPAEESTDTYEPATFIVSQHKTELPLTVVMDNDVQQGHA